ncbi:unnamed protein product [Leuciscus chuanchicus]
MAIPKKLAAVKTNVAASLKSAERVALTCDSWTSRVTDSYVTITCHYIASDWTLVSHVLQTRAVHTASNIVALLNEALNEWGITEKEPALVTDNAANMVRAAELMNVLHADADITAVEDVVKALNPMKAATLAMSEEWSLNDNSLGPPDDVRDAEAPTSPKKPKTSALILLGSVYKAAAPASKKTVTEIVKGGSGKLSVEVKVVPESRRERTPPARSRPLSPQSRLTAPTRSSRAGACELHLDSRGTFDGTLTPP